MIAVFRPALDGLRDRWITVTLLAASILIGTVALWPIASATDSADLVPRLTLPVLHSAVPALDLGPDAAPFTSLQDSSLDSLFRVGLVLGGLLLGTILVTIAMQTLARNEARAPEIAVRRAVGASHRLLLGATLVEAAAIGTGALLAGAAGGALLSLAAQRAWGSVFATAPTLIPLTLLALAVTLLVSSVLSTGARPARRVVERSAQPLPTILPALQFALALIAVTTGALLLDRGGELTHPSATSNAKGQLFALTMNDPVDTRARAVARLLDTLRRDAYDTASLTAPGVVAGLGPVGTAMTDCGVCFQGGLEVRFHYPRATHLVVSPDSFEQLGIHLREGRLLRPSDGIDGPRVAVISRVLAAKHFQNGEALGRRIAIGPHEEWHTVVGVVDDVIPTGFGAGNRPAYTVYLSALQHPPVAGELIVRGPRPGAERVLDASVRRATHLAPPAPRSEADMREGEVRPLRWFGGLYALEGAAILLLGLGGTALQMFFWVRSLENELGLRRSVGATRRRLVLFIAGRAALVAGAGLGLGLWFAPGVWGAIGTQLPGLRPWDPAAVGAVAAISLIVTILAAAIPGGLALRATPAALLAAEN